MRIGMVEQQLRASQTVGLSRREHHLDRIAEGIDQRVVLVVSPPRDRPIAWSPFFCAPALCW